MHKSFSYYNSIKTITKGIPFRNSETQNEDIQLYNLIQKTNDMPPKSFDTSLPHYPFYSLE